MFGLTPWKRRDYGVPTVDPLAFPLAQVSRDVDALLNRMFGDFPLSVLAGREAHQHWGIEAKDEEKSLTLRLDAPGFEAGEFDVQVHDKVLTVKAAQKKAVEGETNGFSVRSFERSLTLPNDVQTDQVEATYRNGVLELVLPKAAHPEAKKITVKA